MKIASGERISNAAHGPHLPTSWRTLYELTKLPDDKFAAKLASGEIHPEMQRKDVARENRIISRARDEARVRSLAPRCRPLPDPRDRPAVGLRVAVAGGPRRTRKWEIARSRRVGERNLPNGAGPTAAEMR